MVYFHLRYYATFLDMIHNENYEIATTTAMAEVVNDLETARMLGLAEEETTTNGIDNSGKEAEIEESVTGETVESTEEVNTSSVIKTVVSVVVMLLGVGIVVFSLRKIKKK